MMIVFVRFVVSCLKSVLVKWMVIEWLVFISCGIDFLDKMLFFVFWKDFGFWREWISIGIVGVILGFI